jgi:hypothetical protein
MPVPGSPSASTGAGVINVTYTSSAANVDVFADAGSPTVIIKIGVTVEPGVVISSTDEAVPSMSMVGFAAGSSGTLLNQGLIQGKGGNGGDSRIIDSPGDTFSYAGGGGGGAGTDFGVGGVGLPIDPASSGVDGTSGTAGVGGAGGVGDTVTPDPGGAEQDATAGANGGDAISIGVLNLIVYNLDSHIQGGGGGGGSSTISSFSPEGGAGGGLAAAGVAGEGGGGTEPTAGGAGGYAIRGTGTITVTSGGSSPNIEGTIGV